MKKHIPCNRISNHMLVAYTIRWNYSCKKASKKDLIDALRLVYQNFLLNIVRCILNIVKFEWVNTYLSNLDGLK